MSEAPIATQLEIAEWQVWISEVMVELRSMRLEAFRRGASTPEEELFARTVMAQAGEFRDLVCNLPDDPEYHQLLEGYQRIIDEARELIA